MSVAEIISSLLETMGFDGLVNADGECGCEIGDLFPCWCNENLKGCEPAYKFECYRCAKNPENGGKCCKSSCDYGYDVLFSECASYCEPDYMRKDGGDD